MTDRSHSLRSSVVGAVVGGCVTILVTILLALGTGAWSSKETVSDHQRDIQMLDAKVQRVLDAVCYGKMGIPVCQR